MNPDAIAVNALAGSSSFQTPGATLQPVWWTEDRIEGTVIVKYVASKLHEEDRPKLHRPLSFGDGLTSDTYLEFIIERAKRLFLILAELGVANRIFSIIDRSYDDGDLPIPFETVADLALSPKGDEKLDKRFYNKQFDYLLRELDEGQHIDYSPNETVPLDYSYRLPSASALHTWLRVRVPKLPNRLLARRLLAMSLPGVSEGFPDEYYDDLETMKFIHHDHIAPMWGSYTYKGGGYLLTPFLAEHTLKSFFEARNVESFQSVSKIRRQRLLVEWMHCLADGLAYLHLNGFQHTAIRPSNIIIDNRNQIAFSDIGTLKSLQKNKKIDPMEVYNYGAPEAHLGERYVFMNSTSPTKPFGASLFRKRSHDNKSISSDDSLEGPYDGASMVTSGQKRAQTFSTVFSFSSVNVNDSMTRVDSVTSPVDARSLHSQHSQTPSKPTEKSDIFSLGCIFLELLTCLHKFKPAELTKHVRSAHKSSKGLHSTRFDCSYHANIPRIITWMNILDERAFDQEPRVFRAVPHLVRLIRAMLSHDSDLRPTASSARDQIYNILTRYATFESQDLHCGSKSHEWESNRASYSTYPSSAVLESAAALEGRSSLQSSNKSMRSDPDSGTGSIGYPSTTAPTLPPPPPPQKQRAQPNFSRLMPWAAQVGAMTV